MREKYTPTIKSYCMITNTEMVLHSIKYYLRKISLNPTSTTYTVHCTNIRMPNYRRGMLQDLTGLKDGVDDYCREEGMRLYKVVSGGELVGFKAEMEKMRQ